MILSCKACDRSCENSIPYLLHRYWCNYFNGWRMFHARSSKPIQRQFGMICYGNTRLRPVTSSLFSCSEVKTLISQKILLCGVSYRVNMPSGHSPSSDCPRIRADGKVLIEQSRLLSINQKDKIYIYSEHRLRL